MKVASNNDGAGVWGGSLLLSIGLHAALIYGLLSVEVRPLEEDDQTVAQIEIMVIERLSLEATLPDGEVESGPLTEEDTVSEPEAPEEIVSEAPPEEVADVEEPEAEEAETAEENTPPEAEAPEPETVEEPEPVEPELVEETAPEAPSETELATEEPEAVETIEALPDPELAEVELPEEPLFEADEAAPAPDEEITDLTVEEQPDIIAAVPDVAQPDFAQAPEDLPDFIDTEGAGGLALGPGVVPAFPEGFDEAPAVPELVEDSAPLLETGPLVGVLSVDDLVETEDAAAPDLAETTVIDESEPPEDLVVAALPPELETVESIETAPEPVEAEPEGVLEEATEARPVDSEEMRQLRLLVERIRLLSDRPCLVALPRRHSGGIVSVEMLGADEAAMAQLEADIFTDLAVEPAGTRRLMSADQCAALDFIREAADYPVMRLGIGLANDPIIRDATRSEIEGLGRLQAAIIARPGWDVTLLMIDDAGVVQDLTEYLFESDGNQQIDVPVRRSGEVQPTRQILLALASAGPLDALRASDGLPADQVFAVQAEALRGVPMAVVTVDIR